MRAVRRTGLEYLGAKDILRNFDVLVVISGGSEGDRRTWTGLQ